MEDHFRRLHILCGAILASLALVNAVLVILLARGELTPAPISRSVPIVLFAVGLVLLVTAPAIKGAVFKRAGAEGFGGEIEKVFNAYRSANIVAFALREAAGLIGFVLAVLTANTWWSWGLGGAAVIAMIFDWPKREHLGI
jgi:hypothetical protein